MDIANARNAGDGLLTQMSGKAGAVTWHQQDYAWTHTTPVEGFFVVLTIVIVPVAILRLLRRLNVMPLVWNRRPHRDLGT